MVVQESSTKTVQETKEESEINPKETPEAKEVESQDSNTEFSVETEELDELQVQSMPILLHFQRAEKVSSKTGMSTKTGMCQQKANLRIFIKILDMVM